MLRSLIWIFVLTAFIRFPMYANQCSASPQNCSDVVVATIPPGGSCIETEFACAATVRTYTANGEFHEIKAVRCDPSLCQ